MLLVATALLTVFCDRNTLTTRQGYNQSLRSIRARSDAGELSVHRENHSLGSRAHSERVVHARGTGAHGWFESFGNIGEEPASKFTRAKVLTQTGVLVDGIDFSDDKMLDAHFVTRTRGVTGSALFYNELFARESNR